MTDKEVGELWRDNGEGHDHWWFDLQITALIRKLVEQKTEAWLGVDADHMTYETALAEALRDYGIDPETWK